MYRNIFQKFVSFLNTTAGFLENKFSDRECTTFLLRLSRTVSCLLNNVPKCLFAPRAPIFNVLNIFFNAYFIVRLTGVMYNAI